MEELLPLIAFMCYWEAEEATCWIMVATACLPALLCRAPAAVYEVIKFVPPTKDDWNY